MKIINGNAAKLLVLPVLVAVTMPVSALGEDEASVEKEEIRQIVIEARETAMEWADKVREWNSGESRKTTYMGVVIESVPSVLRDYIDLPKGVGLLLPRIATDGPAEKAGLVDNDILVKFDGQLVINNSQLSTLINMKGPGSTVPVTIFRKGEEMDFDVTLEERTRKGFHFIHPNAPEAPGVHGDDVGALMEQIDEWIPGSVRVFIDDNEQVHVDMDDLKNDLKGLRTKLAKIHVLRDVDIDNIVMKHGDMGARTTTVHIANKSINYNSDAGRVELTSDDSGKQVKVWDNNDEVLYEGPLSDNYAEELPAKAVELIDALNAIQLDTHGDHIKVELNTDSVEPITMMIQQD